jgi:hypothetical protein
MSRSTPRRRRRKAVHLRPRSEFLSLRESAVHGAGRFAAHRDRRFAELAAGGWSAEPADQGRGQVVLVLSAHALEDARQMQVPLILRDRQGRVVTAADLVSLGERVSGLAARVLGTVSDPARRRASLAGEVTDICVLRRGRFGGPIHEYAQVA